MSKVAKGALIAGAIAVSGGAAIGAVQLATGGAVLGVTSAAYGAALAFVNAMALNALISGVSAQLAGSRKGPRRVENVEYAGTVEPRRIIYGRRLVSGMHCIEPLTSGANNKYLHKALALAGHVCEGVDSIYFNDEAIGSPGSITGTANDGKLTSGPFDNRAWVRFYDGTQTTADYILDNAFSGWTSAHKGQGITYAAIQMQLDDKVYKNGNPQATFLVKGKLCYDPRLDTSPGANPTNASYIAWTDNPALCLADFLISELGLEEDADRIDWDMVVAAADICDETVTIPTNADLSPYYPSGAQPRYTCNLILYATDPFEASIEALAGCMMGSCLYSGGKWRIRAGAWESPSFEITDHNVMGVLEVTTAIPTKERWNGIRGTYIAETDRYQDKEFPPTQDPAYVTDDGWSAFKDVQFPGTVNVFEAQRNAIILTRKSRNKESTTVACDMSLWKVRPGATGIATITELGWVNQQVRCEQWGFSPDGLVALTLRAENAADWDDPDVADYEEPLAISTPTPVYFTPDAPSGLAVVGTSRTINLSWVAPPLMPAGAEFEVYEAATGSPFSSATMVWKGRATSAQLDKNDTTTRDYWVLARMADGTAGPEYPTASAGESAAAEPAPERGSKHFYATGSSWVDATADAAIAAESLTKVLLDVVTISNGTNFAETRFWDGASWATIAQVIDGNLLVAGTVGADKLLVDDEIAVGTGGALRSGKTGYGSGTGWFLDYNGGTPRMDIGDATQYMRWDGSGLAIAGSLNFKNAAQAFTPSWSGFSSAPSGDFSYLDLGNIVIIWAPANRIGTANATTISFSGVPSGIRPAASRRIPLAFVNDNFDVTGAVEVSSAGVVTFLCATVFSTTKVGLFTGSMVSGGQAGVAAGATIIYAK